MFRSIFTFLKKSKLFFLEGVLTRSKNLPLVLYTFYTIKISKRSKCSRQINCDGRKMGPTATAYILESPAAGHSLVMEEVPGAAAADLDMYG